MDDSQRRALPLITVGMATFMGGLIGLLIFGTLHGELPWWGVALAVLGLIAQVVGFVRLRRASPR